MRSKTCVHKFHKCLPHPLLRCTVLLGAFLCVGIVFFAWRWDPAVQLQSAAIDSS